MKEIFETVFGLLGGLAIFIFGMNMMSECLQKVAGEKMKTILGVLTKNPIMGVLAGTLVTAVLQSSSATTVMVIGFVSAGLMTLPQAISVILGANIGTTITAQLIAFNISDYIWVIVFVGFAIFFISKNERTKNIGQTIFAFGLLFVGIETMGAVMKPLAQSPVFTDLIAKVSHIPVLGVLLGTGMTLVVQSSSATIAVLQSFASQPAADGITSAIGLSGAIPILLGDNIGTTITALLACIGQTKNAKRAAVAHSIFNISGSFIFIWIIPLFASFVRFISPKGNEIDVISRQIANAHMTFNVANMLIWIPFIPFMVKIVMTIVRGNDEKADDIKAPKYLDNRMLGQPVAALQLINKEIRYMFEGTKELLSHVKVTFEKNDTRALETIEQKGNYLKYVNDEIVKYMSSLFSGGGMTEELSTEAAGLMYVVNDIDKIAQRCLDISEIARLKIENRFKFSDTALEELGECFELSEKMLQKAQISLDSKDEEAAHDIFKDKEQLQVMERRFNKNHVKRMKKNSCKPELTGAFLGIMQNLERIGNSCTNIVEEIWDRKYI